MPHVAVSHILQSCSPTHKFNAYSVLTKQLWRCINRISMDFSFSLLSFTARTFVLTVVSTAFGHSLSFPIKLRNFNFLFKENTL